MFTRESSVPIDRPLFLPHDFLQARGENNRIVKTNPEHREDRHERWAVSSGQRKRPKCSLGFQCQVQGLLTNVHLGRGVQGFSLRMSDMTRF